MSKNLYINSHVAKIILNRKIYRLKKISQKTNYAISLEYDIIYNM